MSRNPAPLLSVLLAACAARAPAPEPPPPAPDERRVEAPAEREEPRDDEPLVAPPPAYGHKVVLRGPDAGPDPRCFVKGRPVRGARCKRPR
ncbi:MAG: hypothetical protein IT377_30770 [Polyangiaceae bacterium]|nr:hypothetical protein [Polyangiaceae bacterium]